MSTNHKDLKLAGKWTVDVDDPMAGYGTLMIGSILEDGIFDASFEAPCWVCCKTLRLKKSESSIISDGSKNNTLLYKSNTDRWDEVYDEFIMEMKLEYNPDAIFTPDTLYGLIDVFKLDGGSSQYQASGPGSSTEGGSFTFTATRR